MNPCLERREPDSRDLMDTEKHEHQTLQGFFQTKLPIYSRSITKEFDFNLRGHHYKEPI